MTMTTLPPSAAPRPSTALPAPSSAEVVNLQELSGYPAVSVLCTTGPAPSMSPMAATRLRGLVAEAGARLRSELGDGGARPLLERLEELAADVTNRPTSGAVALFVSDSHSSAWGLPVPVVDRTVVDPTFATRDLVRSLHRTPRHVVLVLTESDARLFDGVGDTLLPPFAGPFPLRAVRARPERRDRARGRDRASRDADPDDWFLRTVDDALGTYLRLHPAPLVLVGAERTLSRFTALSRNLGRLAGKVHGSHARTPLPRLVALIAPVLERYLRSRQDEALALLDERTGARRVVSGMGSVWLAARAERPEMLAVEHGLFYPARLSADGDFLTPAEDVDHPDVVDDAVDEVIEIVLRRGGWIALVDDGRLAEHDGIALSLRVR